MAGQVIGSVNVQVGGQNVTSVNNLSYGGGQNATRVNSISYGGQNQLKQATDLNLSGVEDGDVIVYQANTNSFIVQPVDAEITYIDGGSF